VHGDSLAPIENEALPAEPNTLPFRIPNTSGNPFADHLAFQLRKGCEYLERKPAHHDESNGVVSATSQIVRTGT
jgi:hypothetical protein